MSLAGRRRQSAGDKWKKARRMHARRNAPRECAMRDCSNTTTEPLGYCTSCWPAGAGR